MKRQIAVVGSGYVGTVVAACLGTLGHQVVGVEIDPAKLGSLKQNRAPFHEAGLDDLLQIASAEGNLSFTDDLSRAVSESEVIFLCVGTPPGHNGEPDMSSVAAAARSIAGALHSRHILINKSTVPIGTGQWLASIIEEALPDPRRSSELFTVVSNPEFLREGTAIQDFFHPDRVVLGSNDQEALDVVEDIYRPILDQTIPGGDLSARPPLIRTSAETAEMIKYASNAFLATKISFINEIANICELVGADVTEVAGAMGIDRRIGPQFLEAGIGWGGSCFGKDLDALIATAMECGYEPALLEASHEVNRGQRDAVCDKLRRTLKGLRGRRIGLLGLAFKPGTDDLRDAPALDIARNLIGAGALVSAFDPVVQRVPIPELKLVPQAYDVAYRADAVVLATEWPEFLGLDFAKIKSHMRGNVFIDGRNLFDPATVKGAGLRYESMGRTHTTSRASSDDELRR